MRLQLVAKIGDERTTVSVSPFGSDQRQNKVLDLRHWSFEPDKEDPVSALGIRPRGAQIEPILAEVQANSAASKAGLQAGDRIVKVDGQPLTQWMTFVTWCAIIRVRRSRWKLKGRVVHSLTLIPDSKSVGKRQKGLQALCLK